MESQYLTRKEIAQLFNSSEKAAEKQLLKIGLFPDMNLGPGRGCGKRWLQSAVMEAIQKIHEKAQPKSIQPTTKPVKPKSGIKPTTAMTATELQNFLKKPSFTTHPTIQ